MPLERAIQVNNPMTMDTQPDGWAPEVGSHIDDRAHTAPSAVMRARHALGVLAVSQPHGGTNEPSATNSLSDCNQPPRAGKGVWQGGTGARRRAAG